MSTGYGGGGISLGDLTLYLEQDPCCLFIGDVLIHFRQVSDMDLRDIHLDRGVSIVESAVAACAPPISCRASFSTDIRFISAFHHNCIHVENRDDLSIAGDGDTAYPRTYAHDF